MIYPVLECETCHGWGTIPSPGRRMFVTCPDCPSPCEDCGGSGMLPCKQHPFSPNCPCLQVDRCACVGDEED